MSLGEQGEHFPCFVCGMTLLYQGWGVKCVPIPCKLEVSFWKCWNEPNTIEAYDFLENERDAEVSDLVLIVVYYSKNKLLS